MFVINRSKFFSIKCTCPEIVIKADGHTDANYLRPRFSEP